MYHFVLKIPIKIKSILKQKSGNPYLKIYYLKLPNINYILRLSKYAQVKLTENKPKVLFTSNKPNKNWVFSDRPKSAQDNAEALYDYIMKIDKATNCYFIIHQKSPDYNRLVAKGFKVIPYGTRQHYKTQAQCQVLISSSADDEVLYPWGKILKKLQTKPQKFVFLQHGLINNEIETWLNTRQDLISLMIASGSAEYKYLCSDRLKIDNSKIKLTGLARHDKLQKLSKPKVNQILMFMSWRSELTHITQNTFTKSYYYQKFIELLQDEQFNHYLTSNNLTLKLLIHPVFNHYKLPKVSSNIKIAKNEEISNLINDSSIIITDYSSLASDFSYLQKPIIYYYFDLPKSTNNLNIKNQIINRSEIGTICYNINEIIETIKFSNQNSPSQNNLFKYNDTANSSRIYYKIKNLLESEIKNEKN